MQNEIFIHNTKSGCFLYLNAFAIQIKLETLFDP